MIYKTETMESFRDIVPFWPYPTVLLSALFVLILWTAVKRLLHVQYDPQEPPIIPHRIPYIGHVIGIFHYGAKYFQMISDKYHHPIYTLPTLTIRTYIITSPSLAATIQRSSKHTSFYSVILEVTKRLVAFDDPSMSIIHRNANRETGDWGLMPESHDMIASVLGPGPTLNSMSLTQLDQFSEMLNDITASSPLDVELHAWVRSVFTTSNAYAIYGPKNLFAVHPSLVRDFWVFEEGMIPLLANVWPRLTAPKPYYARQRILSALVEFVTSGAYKHASPLIQKRVSINLKHGLTPTMAGHAELIMLFGILGNAVPTTFWLLANIFSRPDLLSEIRQEISPTVTITKPEGETNEEVRTISVSALRNSCPLLVSTYRETLRTIANLSSVRWTLSDTHLPNPSSSSFDSAGEKSPSPSQYVLKANSIVQIASGVIHTDSSIWGSDASTFNPRRFITTSPPPPPPPPPPQSHQSNKTATSSSSSSSNNSHNPENNPPTNLNSLPALPKNVPSAAYRAFGGGSVICPGRHFAQSEICGFIAMVVMGFDVLGGRRRRHGDRHGDQKKEEEEEEEGKNQRETEKEEEEEKPMTLPEKDDGKVPLAVMKPKGDCRVRIRRRRGMESVKWAFEL